MVNFHQNGRTELQAKLTERSAEPVRSISAERSAEPFGFGRTLTYMYFSGKAKIKWYFGLYHIVPQ